MTITAFCPECKKILTTRYGPFECCGYSFEEAYKHNRKHPPKSDDTIKAIAEVLK